MGVARYPRLLIIAALLVTACGVDRGTYVRENERLLESLPEIAGSDRLRVDSSPYYLQEMGPADGYTTNEVYRAPAGMTADEVIDFYVGELRGEWEYCFENIPIRSLEDGEIQGFVKTATFYRASSGGTAIVSLNTDGMVPGQAGSFEIVVDHDTSRNFCTGEDLR